MEWAQGHEISSVVRSHVVGVERYDGFCLMTMAVHG